MENGHLDECVHYFISLVRYLERACIWNIIYKLGFDRYLCNENILKIHLGKYEMLHNRNY